MRARAISIRQPYVELILRGEKRFEYRSRPTKIRGNVLIYATKKPADTTQWNKLDICFEELPSGLIVGSIEITDCVYFEDSDDFGYELSSPKRFRSPYKPHGTPQPLFFWCDNGRFTE